MIRIINRRKTVHDFSFHVGDIRVLNFIEFHFHFDNYVMKFVKENVKIKLKIKRRGSFVSGGKLIFWWFILPAYILSLLLIQCGLIQIHKSSWFFLKLIHRNSSCLLNPSCRKSESSSYNLLYCILDSSVDISQRVRNI